MILVDFTASINYIIFVFVVNIYVINNIILENLDVLLSKSFLFV
jgi:hypothetical protein